MRLNFLSSLSIQFSFFHGYKKMFNIFYLNFYPWSNSRDSARTRIFDTKFRMICQKDLKMQFQFRWLDLESSFNQSHFDKIIKSLFWNKNHQTIDQNAAILIASPQNSGSSQSTIKCIQIHSDETKLIYSFQVDKVPLKKPASLSTLIITLVNPSSKNWSPMEKSPNFHTKNITKILNPHFVLNPLFCYFALSS